jgi:hypothetical protein
MGARAEAAREGEGTFRGADVDDESKHGQGASGTRLKMHVSFPSLKQREAGWFALQKTAQKKLIFVKKMCKSG